MARSLRLLVRLARWLNHLVLSLLIALGVGGLSYAAAQAIASAALIYEQQPFFRETTAVLREGDITALAGSRLHEVRQQVEALAARDTHRCVQVGIVAAFAAAVVSYLWMERKTWERRESKR
ncbi:MAG: hypothetical protein HC884_10195 [Chloroflexaceae bacterium]|nr:hypothetical protein [Chloroflexaceae bacterium]